MKTHVILILALGLLFACGQKGQGGESNQTTDSGNSNKPKSPRQELTGKIDDINVIIRWGAPSVRGREIWGKLVPYDNVWRTGADSATYVEFSRDVTINGQLLPKGRYALFTIPTAADWTIIFNETWNQWGSFDHNPDKDVLKVIVKPEDITGFQEALQFFIENNDIGYAWEQKRIRLTVQ